MDHRKSLLFVVTFALILIPACSTSTVSPQTASATPVTIQDIKLQITSATRQASYMNPITQKVYTPDDTQRDEVMVVEAKVLSGDIGKVSDWRDVWITDENGRETSPGSVTTKPDGTVIWPIVVQKSSHSFTLHLPDSVTVNLDSLVK